MPAAKAAAKGKPIDVSAAVGYKTDSVVSKTLLDKRAGSLTLFAFDAGQGLSEHTAPYDATVLVVDGEALLTIGGRKVRAKAGEAVVMPANVPHALHAAKRFKMLLVMVRS